MFMNIQIFMIKYHIEVVITYKIINFCFYNQMAMKTRLSAVFGLLAGGIAGFITRDDYSFPS